MNGIEIKDITGIGEFSKEDLTKEGKKEGELYKTPTGKVFAVQRIGGDGSVKTVEVRTDGNLAEVLKARYESVMKSRYFGRGGIEIVVSGQLAEDEIADLIRLSYNLSK